MSATPKPLSIQVGGSHYKENAIQPVEYIVANNIPFLEGNAIKYITRHRLKNGRQDLEKAVHYLQMAMEFYYPQEKRDGEESRQPASDQESS